MEIKFFFSYSTLFSIFFHSTIKQTVQFTSNCEWQTTPFDSLSLVIEASSSSHTRITSFQSWKHKLSDFYKQEEGCIDTSFMQIFLSPQLPFDTKRVCMDIFALDKISISNRINTRNTIEMMDKRSFLVASDWYFI